MHPGVTSLGQSPACQKRYDERPLPHGATPYCAKDRASFIRQQSLRRLDEIERQLDRMIEELRPSAIRYAGAIVQGRTEGPKKQFSRVAMSP